MVIQRVTATGLLLVLVRLKHFGTHPSSFFSLTVVGLTPQFILQGDVTPL